MEDIQVVNAAVAKLGDVPIAAIPPESWTVQEVFVPDPDPDPDRRGEPGEGGPDGTGTKLNPQFIEDQQTYSEAAQMCGATYYIHRNAVLAAYPWTWATRRVQLDRRDDDPNTLYTHTFWLPRDADFLGIGVRAVYRSRDDSRPLTERWTRYKDGVTADYAELWADYLENVPTTGWPPLLIHALVLKLCSEWAYYFVDQANLKQMYEAEFTAAFNDAKRVDAQGKPAEGIEEFALIEARYRGASRRSSDGFVVPGSTFWADGGRL